MIYKYKQERQTGISLIELLLVLAIITILIVIGINRYQKQKLQTEVDTVQQNVSLLLDAAEIYYLRRCQRNEPFKISMDILNDNGLLPLLIKVPLVNKQTDSNYYYKVDAEFVTNIKPSGRPVYRLLVSANLNVPEKSMNYYKTLLNTYEVNGNTLTWTKMPTFSSANLKNNLWIMGLGLDFYREQETNESDYSCGY